MYQCESMNESPDDCGDLINRDMLKVNVNRVEQRQVVINDVIVTPNNLRNEPSGNFYQDLYVQFTPSTTLPYDEDIKNFPKVMVVIPYGY